MDTVISLSEQAQDWALLIRAVERSGTPIWLELDGTVQGVLLPSADVRRLMGRYTQTRQPIETIDTCERARPEDQGL